MTSGEWRSASLFGIEAESVAPCWLRFLSWLGTAVPRDRLGLWKGAFMTARPPFRRWAWVQLLVTLLLAACAPPTPPTPPPVLLFDGSGTSPNDVIAIRKLLEASNLAYATVDSSHLNGMSEQQLGAYRLLIVPGGNYITMGDGLTPATANKVHDAVQGGLNYLGVCAGALLAGRVANNGLDLAGGARFGFHALVDRGVHKAAVKIATAGGPALEHYWEDGPQFTGWGAVVGRYPDGTPAVVEGRSGKGWVVLVGTHPEAPDSWFRGVTDSAAAGPANAFARTLVEAALNGTELPHY